MASATAVIRYQPRRRGILTRILSMGAGVQTTALLLKFPERYDHIVFADTGDEEPETYYYIEKYLKPHCKEQGLDWVTVRFDKYDSLMDFCFKEKTLPIMRTRECTRRFKIDPIKKFVKSIGATAKNPVYEDIGFPIDESHRIGSGKFDVQYLKKEYPLIDHRISRKMCYKIIEDHGWPVPKKSGCDYCPFKSRKEFRELYRTRPERFLQIVNMEKNDRHYPRHPLDTRAPLENIMLAGSMDTFFDDDAPNHGCDSGHCFT